MGLTPEQITAQNFQDFYRQILPYLNKGNGGTSDTPLGQVAFFDDLVAPYGWLVADGTVYNISDYPDLANQYERVHGSKNFYGGNGTTTFAVPNWQGEFLRASGTNSRADQGNGAAVGAHQNATEIPTIVVARNQKLVVHGIDSDNANNIYYSDRANSAKSVENVYDLSSNTSTERAIRQSVRPTNTSLLLCIKAIPSSEMNVYSLTERRVGTWIDSSAIYEKVVATGGAVPSGATLLYRQVMTGYDAILYTKA